mmetsp:Transcript_154508/g.495301  ORF Transcript_154508/g.495301 Transcript_154508/m.495301 type:complete len:252 (+) Transcript_154508:547-1302(+)
MSRMHHGQACPSNAKSWPSTLFEMRSANVALQCHQEAPEPQDQPADIEELRELPQACARPCKVPSGSRVCKPQRIAKLSLEYELAVPAKKSDSARTCKHAGIGVRPSVSTPWNTFQAMVWHQRRCHTLEHLRTCWLSQHVLLRTSPSQHPCSVPCSARLSSTTAADAGSGPMHAQRPDLLGDGELRDPLPSTQIPDSLSVSFGRQVGVPAIPCARRPKVQSPCLSRPQQLLQAARRRRVASQKAKQMASRA